MGPGLRLPITALFLGSTLTVGNPLPARAQSCCSPATTPSAAIEHPAPRRGELVLGLYAEHYPLSGGKRGREPFAYPGDRRVEAQVVSLTGHYGLSNRISAGAILPFNRRERSDRATGGDLLTRSGSGIGDVAALAYLSLLERPARREWTLGAGLKLATGRNRSADESGELPEELQPGTGANDVLLTSTFAQSLGSLTVSAGLTWRGTGTLVKIDAVPAGPEVSRRYAFGNEVLYGVAAGWSPRAPWGLEIGVRGRHAEPDRATSLNPDGSTTADLETVPSTGGERVFLAPVVRCSFAAPRATFSIGLLIPVHENVRGSQLSARTGLRAGFEVQP